MPIAILKDSVSAAWVELLSHLLDSNTKAAPRGQETRELMGVQLTITDMCNNILVNSGRDLNYRFMVAEWLWIALGRNDVQGLAKFNKKMLDFSDNGLKLEGSYGPPVYLNKDYVISKLQEDRNSRQAVINIWKNYPSPSKDIPCTLSMQFLIRNEKLHMIVNMRSSDIWLGIPYDIFNFSMIGITFAGILVAEPGSLVLNLGSSHMYERDANVAVCALNQWDSFTLKSRYINEWPPNYLNCVFEDNIHALPYRPHPWEKYIRVMQQPTKVAALGELKRWLDPDWTTTTK